MRECVRQPETNPTQTRSARIIRGTLDSARGEGAVTVYRDPRESRPLLRRPFHRSSSVARPVDPARVRGDAPPPHGGTPGRFVTRGAKGREASRQGRTALGGVVSTYLSRVLVRRPPRYRMFANQGKRSRFPWCVFVRRENSSRRDPRAGCKAPGGTRTPASPEECRSLHPGDSEVRRHPATLVRTRSLHLVQRGVRERGSTPLL